MRFHVTTLKDCQLTIGWYEGEQYVLTRYKIFKITFVTNCIEELV